MPPIDREMFQKYWEATEVIRAYQNTLYTFGDMQLPYVFAREHPTLKDRVILMKGVMLVQKPMIILPGREGPSFGEGFEHGDSVPPDAIQVWRSVGIPRCNISNRATHTQEIMYGTTLQAVLDKYNRRMENEADTATGLVKGIEPDISLMRYSLGLVFKSVPGNVQEFIEHQRRERGDQIRPDEGITEEDIRKMFE